MAPAPEEVEVAAAAHVLESPAESASTSAAGPLEAKEEEAKEENAQEEETEDAEERARRRIAAR